MRWVASFTSASKVVIDSELATHSSAAPSGPSPRTVATCSHHATSIPAAASAGAISQGSSTPWAVSQSDRISSLSATVSASSVAGSGAASRRRWSSATNWSAVICPSASRPSADISDSEVPSRASTDRVAEEAGLLIS